MQITIGEFIGYWRLIRYAKNSREDSIIPDASPKM
jgi:hypothetical protein